MQKYQGLCLTTVLSLAIASYAGADATRTYNFATKEWTSSNDRDVTKHGNLTVKVIKLNTFRYKATINVGAKSYFSDVPKLFSDNLPGVGTVAAGGAASAADGFEALRVRVATYKAAVAAYNALLSSIRGVALSTDDVEQAKTQLDRIFDKTLTIIKKVDPTIDDNSRISSLSHDARIHALGTALILAGDSLAADVATNKTLSQPMGDFLDKQADLEKAAALGGEDATRIYSGDYMTVVKGPITVASDEVTIDVLVSELSSTGPATTVTSSGNPKQPAADKATTDKTTTGTPDATKTPADTSTQTKAEDDPDTHIQLPVTFGWFRDFKADFSTGLLVTHLTDSNLVANPVAGSSPQSYKIGYGASEDYAAMPSALLHLIIYKDRGFTFGPSVGVGGATGSIRYLTGASLAFGREQRMSFDFGLAWGQVNRLNGASVGDTITSTTVPTSKVWRNALYYGISYNF